MRIISYILLFLCVYTNKGMAQTEPDFQLSTHILDISQGKPAPGVAIILFRQDLQTKEFKQIASATTDENGRIGNFLPDTTNNEGIYKLLFETQPYFKQQNIPSIYPYIEVVFQLEGNGHYHIPITLSANGYSTYRGN